MQRPLSLIACAALFAGFPYFVQAGGPEYISDEPEIIAGAQQGWGELGLNVAAHQTGIAGQPLQIGNRNYSRGLGHHANGRIDVALDGLYTTFEAELGVQPCPGGSVIFRILVDGQQKFQSPVLRSGGEPLPVRVNLAGAQELTLLALDSGDGIVCDMANWAEARLTPAPQVAGAGEQPPKVDIACFGRTVTWDPARTNGATASRIEEFRAEDVFTETELKQNRNGTFTIPASEKPGCVGLQWLDQRHVRELGLEFADPAQMPLSSDVRVEAWVGESAWQGDWTPAQGEIKCEGGKMTFVPGRKTPVHTRKVRWIIPGRARAAEVRLTAFSRSHWARANLLVQCDPAKARGNGTIFIYNGRKVPAGNIEGKSTPDRGVASGLKWNLSQPIRIPVLYSRPSFFAESTLLRFHLPSGDVSVAISDVLTNDCVYLPDFGLFVTRDPAPVRLADYKRRIGSHKTILEQVREMPEQTLAQAMQKTHRDYQRNGPVMISLACDNSKYVVERDGVVSFQPEPFDWSRPYYAWYAAACQLRPQFGSGRNSQIERHLDGGWLPIPVISVTVSGIRYTQRAFVAPLTEQEPDGELKPAKSVCVIEFTCTNETAESATANLALRFAQEGPQRAPAELAMSGSRIAVQMHGHPIAFVGQTGSSGEPPRLDGGEVKIAQNLKPGEKATTVVWVMSDGVKPEEVPGAGEVAELRDRTGKYWAAQLDKGMRINTPDEWLNNTIRSSVARCLIAGRNEAEGRRVGASIAAMTYGPLESEAHSVIRGMDFLGQHEFAKRSLDYFIHRYNTNGFLTTGYTTFGTAWHLWTLGEHYELGRDTNWLRQVAPEVARVCHWIIRQTEKTKRLDAQGKPVPEFGLMPPGVLADWNAFAYHFAMNGYYSAALREAGLALASIGHPDAKLFIAKSEELRRNTLRAYQWTQGRAPALPLRDGTWIPYYPSQVHSPGRLGEFFPGQDSGRSWCYDVELGAHQLIPAGALSPNSREVGSMMNHMEDVQFLADGWFDYPAEENRADWFNLGGFSKVQPYYTRNAEIYALRDDVKPFIRSYFNTLAAMISPEVLTFWEHFHDAGAYDKTHETGYFLHQTRTMLIQERRDELWLAPFIPAEWLKDGSRVAVVNAPTRFGNAGYEIASHIDRGYMEVRIEPPPGTPREIVLRLRHPEGARIHAVTLNGKGVRTYDPATGILRLKPAKRSMNLRLDFAPASA